MLFAFRKALSEEYLSNPNLMTVAKLRTKDTSRSWDHGQVDDGDDSGCILHFRL